MNECFFYLNQGASYKSSSPIAAQPQAQIKEKECVTSAINCIRDQLFGDTLYGH
jgi:hypothetical protein